MGKKNRRTKVGSVKSIESMPRPLRREILELVGTLLERCSNPFGGGKSEWDDFLEIHAIVEKLRKKQQGYIASYAHRAEHISEFMDWLREHDVDTSAVSIEEFDVGGYGLKANKDIQMSELFLSIPRKIMMSTQTAKASVLGPVMSQDRILQAMPNVVLALHLLCEKADPHSFWAPYINILPSTYSTFLYFSSEELELLKGSHVLSNVINQYRNIARQYAYFFKLFQSYPDADCQLPIKNFCFDDYRWAVSTVMTRQNQIPLTGSQQMDTALIPFWDMCNHCNGKITTDFSLEKDCSECYSLRDFRKEEQVFIFYGPRSNAELFVHSGFVYRLNEFDRLSLQLGISKDDPLYSMKCELLARMSMLPSRLFSLHQGSDPVDTELLVFLRVFSMNQDSLHARLTGENSTALVSQLKQFDEFVNLETELKAWSFLETRMNLLLRSCESSPFNKYVSVKDGEDECIIDGQVNAHMRMCIQMRLAEKRILVATRDFASQRKRSIESQTHHTSVKATAKDKFVKLSSEEDLNTIGAQKQGGELTQQNGGTEISHADEDDDLDDIDDLCNVGVREL